MCSWTVEGQNDSYLVSAKTELLRDEMSKSNRHIPS